MTIWARNEAHVHTQNELFYVLVKRVEGTHSAEGLKLFVRDETSIQAKQEDRSVGEHASEDDQVVHVGTGHLD